MIHTEYWGEPRVDTEEYVPWPVFGPPRLLKYVAGRPQTSVDRQMMIFGWSFGRITRYYWDGNNWQTPVVVSPK